MNFNCRNTYMKVKYSETCNNYGGKVMIGFITITVTVELGNIVEIAV